MADDPYEGGSYYEALGFDTLVPNTNFAQYFNPDGELEVGDYIIKVTPVGTYKFTKAKESYFRSLYENNNGVLSGSDFGENIKKIADDIFLYKTFNTKESDYSLISSGNYEMLPDESITDSKNVSKATSEPNINSFDTFSAERQTFVGRLIQNIIGSTKDHTINFSSSRRVKGSFYFYNYGVYSEIGVQGWTDKKNWIGWSKTEADELRVGWSNVVIKRKIPDFYANSINAINNIIYYPPVYTTLPDGKRVNIATLVMPDFSPTLLDRVKTEGTKALYDVLKGWLGSKPSAWDNAQAVLVASRTDLYYITLNEDIKQYNTKSYTHVFANHWMSFTVSYNSQTGISINGINDPTKMKQWFNAIDGAFNESKPELIKGEVYICARFGNDWRGMRIVKN